MSADTYASNQRIQARIAHTLEEGESVVAAQALTNRGPRAVTTWMAQTDVVASLPGIHDRIGVESGLVLSERRFPTGFLMIMTEHRVLAFSRSVSGKPKELLDVWSNEDLVLDVIDQGSRIKSRLFFFLLPDSSVAVGEAPINGSALDESDRFVACFNRSVPAGV